MCCNTAQVSAGGSAGGATPGAALSHLLPVQLLQLVLLRPHSFVLLAQAVQLGLERNNRLASARGHTTAQRSAEVLLTHVDVHVLCALTEWTLCVLEVVRAGLEGDDIISRERRGHVSTHDGERSP